MTVITILIKMRKIETLNRVSLNILRGEQNLTNNENEQV